MTHTHAPGPGTLFGGLALGHALAQHWWLLALRGVAAIVFGVAALLLPGLTLLTLTLVWGAYAFIDGALSLWAAISGKGAAVTPRWWLGVVGVLGLAAGVAAFVAPVAVARALLLFIAAWAIVTGVLQIWGGVRLRKEISSEWLLIVGGLIWAAFGVLMIAQPGAGALGVAWMIGVFAIVAGCDFIGLAFRLKRHKERFIESG